MIDKKRFEEIVEEVCGWFDEAPKEQQKLFLDEENLGKYHFSFGMTIRNKCGLWRDGSDWVPKIKDGVDVSPDHPDAISMRIIERVQEIKQSERG